MRLLALLLLTSIFIQKNQAQNDQFSVRLKKGDKFSRVTDVVADVKQITEDEELISSSRFTSYAKYEMIEKLDRGYVLKVVYDSLFIVFSAGGRSSLYSSEDNEINSPISVTLSEMKNKPFKILCTPSGRIIGTEYMDTLYSTKNRNIRRLPAADREHIRKLQQLYFSGKGYISNFQLFTNIYPEQPTEKINEWILTHEMMTMYTGEITLKYTLDKKGTDGIKLEGKGTTTTNKNIAFIQSIGTPMAYDLTGETIASYNVSPKTGLVIQGNIKFNLKGDAILASTPDVPEEKSVPMETTIKITLEPY